MRSTNSLHSYSPHAYFSNLKKPAIPTPYSCLSCFQLLLIYLNLGPCGPLIRYFKKLSSCLRCAVINAFVFFLILSRPSNYGFHTCIFVYCQLALYRILPSRTLASHSFPPLTLFNYVQNHILTDAKVSTSRLFPLSSAALFATFISFWHSHIEIMKVSLNINTSKFTEWLRCECLSTCMKGGKSKDNCRCFITTEN